MTRDPVSVSEDLNILDCAKYMVHKGTGSLVVKNKDNISGFVTQDDLLWAFIKKSAEDLSKTPISSIARKKIHTISPNEKIEDAMIKMQRLKIERLPVVVDKKLVGMLTMKDLIAFNPGLAADLRSLFDIREQERKLKRLPDEKRSEGFCEVCGDFEIVENVGGKILCKNCKEDLR